MRKKLTLIEAIRSKRVTEFAAQEEKRSVKPLALGKFDKALGKIVKPQRSKRQTSHSQDGASSRGK